jgi:uncharacterized protein
MPITALYAGLLTVLLLVLTVRVIGRRRAKRVEIGDGADTDLLRRMRVHANFVEYTPYALILMGLAESLRASPIALHAIGLVLSIGRAIHAYGLSQTPHNMRLRVGGMAMTLIAIVAGALSCVVLALRYRATF